MELQEVLNSIRKQYGDLVKFPGLFGNPDMAISFNPDHFEIIFRTEGQWPERLSLDTLVYHRRNYRSSIFKEHQGLLNT